MATPVVKLITELQRERTQAEFARFLGVDRSFLWRVLAGERSADSIIVRLLERFPEHSNQIAAAARETAAQQPDEVPT